MRTANRASAVTVAAALGAFLLVSLAPATARSQVAKEYAIKAAFLYNFTKFVEWPAGAFSDDHAPIVVGILGPDLFGSTLDDVVSGKLVDGRPLVIRRLQRSTGIDAFHVLFISSRKLGAFTARLPSLADRPILTVSDADGFTELGGMIQFIVRQNKIRFRINVTAAERTGLKISSRLLNLAEVVKHVPAGKDD